MTRRTVVPFDRSAAYWAARARRHYTPARLPEAARLMRKALETSGDGAVALELAEIYSGMECETAAERCLLKAVAREGLTGGACCAAARCAFARGDEGLAEEALELCLRLDPEGPYADQAQWLLENHPWEDHPLPPRCARSDTLCRRGRAALLEGDLARARDLAWQAWAKGRFADSALLFASFLRLPQARLPYLAFAAKRSPDSLPALLMLAQCSLQAGNAPQAQRQMLRARALCDTLSQAEAYCAAAWEMHQPQLALSLCAEALSRAPASVEYLRLKYLSPAPDGGSGGGAAGAANPAGYRSGRRGGAVVSPPSGGYSALRPPDDAVFRPGQPDLFRRAPAQNGPAEPGAASAGDLDAGFPGRRNDLSPNAAALAAHAARRTGGLRPAGVPGSALPFRLRAHPGGQAGKRRRAHCRRPGQKTHPADGAPLSSKNNGG